MEGNFPNSMYNRKSSVVVKKPVRWVPVLIIDSIRKKNQTVIRIIGPVRIIGT